MARNRTWLAAALALSTLGASAPLAGAAEPAQRYAHSATLLPNRDILIAGGIDDDPAGNITDTAWLVRGSTEDVIPAASLNVARASHTATLMPNGEVLVAGGFSAPGNALDSAEIYNPIRNCWRSGISLAQARGNHTATLLRDGTVLVCGGNNSAGTALSLCEIFTPTNPAPPNCDTYGSFANGPTFSQARANHTASMLANGRVFFAGGYNKDASPQWLNTTEVYVPGQGFISAHPLGQARAFHTATTLGDGKVLLVGGFNGRNTLESLGFLESTELYDPVSDSVVYAKSMDMRRMGHTATLNGDGSVTVLGGLGNVTTTYISNVSVTLLPGSEVNGLGVGSIAKMSTNVVQGGALNFELKFPLSKDVDGHIVDGDIFFSSPGIRSSWGETWFTPGNIPARSGLRMSLNGTSVVCQSGTCGIVDGSFALTPDAGAGVMLFFDGISASPAFSNISAGSVEFAGPIDEGESGAITGGSLTGSLVLSGLPKAWVGHTVASGSIVVSNAELTTIYANGDPRTTISLTSGTIDLSGRTVANDNDTAGKLVFSATINGLGGLVTCSTPTTQTSPASAALHPWARSFTSFNGKYSIVMQDVDVANDSFVADKATVVIRSMIFSDIHKYLPSSPNPAEANTWTVTHRRYGAWANAPFNHTATLTPSGDILFLGGRGCSDIAVGACTISAVEHWTAILPAPRTWADVSVSPGLDTRRGNHTATTLPDGSILLAGGTNGANILASAELFDALAGTTGPTGFMREVRSLHTATLLPNGRVLVAGGYSTNQASSGSIQGTEIYYPDTRLWIPTAPMISSRSLHTAVLTADGNVMVIGGYANGQYLSGVEIYYSTAAAWRAASSLAQGRAVHTATRLKDGRILVAGGQSASGVLDSVEIYDPATGLWSAASALPTGVHSHTATLLPDGTVLVAGGNDGFGEVPDSYIYDPAHDAGGWIQTKSPLSSPRHNHTATLLPNGKVLVAGGAQAVRNAGDPINNVELFDPMFSTWTSAGSLNRTRAYHTMTVAANGWLYLIGGYDGTSFLTQMERTFYTGTPDMYTVGSAPYLRQASMTATDASLYGRSDYMTVKGYNFQGVTEASGGGAGSANSDHRHPRLVLQSVEGSGGGASQGNSGYLLDVTTKIYQNSGANLWTQSDSSITIQLPADSGLAYGWYHVRAGANDQLSPSRLARAGPPLPTTAVTDPSGTVLGASSVTFSWTAPAAGTWDGYNVYSASTSMWLGRTTDTHISLGGLAPSSTCQLLIAPYTLSGDGPQTLSPMLFTLPNKPLSPVISSATASDLVLSWDANDNGQGTIFEIEQSTDGFVLNISTPFPQLAGLTTDHTLIPLLIPNYPYSFRIRAYNLAGVPSDYSDVVSTQTRVNSGAPLAIVQSPSALLWTWTSVVGAMKYYVYNATSGYRLAEVDAPITSWSQTGLRPNSIHSIFISVVNPAGEGPISPSATAYTYAEAPIAGGPGITVSSQSITASWGQAGNPMGTTYELRISSQAPGASAVGTTSTTVVSTVLGVPMTGTISNLPPSELYAIAVRAFNNDPDGNPDKPTSWFSLSASSVATLPDEPRDMIVTGSGPDYISVSWDNGRESSSSTYEVTYTSVDVSISYGNWAIYGSTSLDFSQGRSLNAWPVSGLLTSTTYTIRVRAANPLGATTAYSASTNSITDSGGAPIGSISATLSATRTTVLTGTVDNPVDYRRIILRSPAGAFTSDTRVTISTYAPGAGLCNGSTARAYSVSVSPALQPVLPLLFTVYYADADVAGKDLSRLTMMRYDPTSGRCVPLATTVDRTAKAVTAQLNHLSVFQIDEWQPSATLASARVYPNPFYAGRDGFVTFDSMPANARLRLYTLRGEMILDQRANASGIVVWPGTNRGGRPVASGVYLAVIESGSFKKILKTAVIR